MAGAVVALAVPLAAASNQIANDELRRSDVQDVAQRWAADHSWSVVNVDTGSGGVVAHMAGPLPIPPARSFRTALDSRGLR